MNEPLRLSASGSPLAQELLRAGRRERPGESAKITAASAAVLAVGKAPLSGLGLGKALRWFFFLTVGPSLAVLAGVGSDQSAPLVADDVRVDDHSALTLVPLPFVPHLAETTTPTTSKHRPAAPSTPAETAAPTSPTTPAPPTETDLLRRARIASVNGDPAVALAILDEHARLYPMGKRREEADALRVETLARSRDAAGAQAAAKVFAARYPSSVYLERVLAAARRASSTAPPR